MSLDDKLTSHSIVWQNVLDGIVCNAEKYLFNKDSIIELKYEIVADASGYAKIDLSAYTIRAILDLMTVRYEDYRSSLEAIATVEDSLLVTEYSLHGRMLIIKADATNFYLKLRFIGCLRTNLKDDIDNELKLFYLSMIEHNPNDIYNSMTRLSNAYKNTVAENSQNIEVVKKSYSQVKLNRF